MGFFANQMRSVIEWKDPSPDLLIWKWTGTNDELKDASKLIINPGQAAIFVYEGQIKAIHDYAGMFELRTANVPFWTTISKVMQNFTSEHKANIYFVRTTTFLNQKWGTKSPVKYQDPVYKFPVGLRAFGNFSFHITRIRDFFTEFSSTVDEMPIFEIKNIIVDRIMLPLTEVLAKSGFSYAEIDSNRMKLSKELSTMVAPEFETLGFEMADFRIENTDFDEKTQERIDKISDKMADAHAINAMGNINSQGLNAYSTIERLNAMNTAAANPNGMAGMGVGMSAGMGLGAGVGMTSAFNQMPSQPQQTMSEPKVTCGCGANMNATAKFCPECGKQNSAGKAPCVHCQAQINEDAKFCPECGKPQASACPKCSAQVKSGTKFCPECGEKFS